VGKLKWGGTAGAMVGLSATVFISIHPDWLKDHPHWTWSIYGL